MKNAVFSLILFILSISNLSAQNELLTEIKEGNFKGPEKKIEKMLANDPNDITANYLKANLLIQKKHESFNPDLAYTHILLARDLYEQITDKTILTELRKEKVSNTSIKLTLGNVYKAAMDYASSINTPESFQHFLSYYTTADETYKLRAKEKIDMFDYDKIKESNCTPCYEKFISEHTSPKATYLAQQKIYQLEFDAAQLLNTKEAYKAYMDKYPASSFYTKAKSRYKLMNSVAVMPSDSWIRYKRALEQNPNEAHADELRDSILQIGLRYEDASILRYCIERFDPVRAEKALFKFYELFTNDGDLQTLQLFFTYYKDDLLKKERKRDVAIAQLADSLRIETPYNPSKYEQYKRYISKAGNKELAFVALQRMIAKDIATENWQAAIDTVNAFKPLFTANHKKVDNLIQLLAAVKDNTVQIHSIGKGINTDAGEYVPVVTADDKTMYFCGNHRLDSIGGEDIFVAYYTENGWGDTKIVKELSFPKTNDAPLSISADGTKLLLFKNGEIYISAKSKQGWLLPQKLPKTINSENWQGDAMITADGKALLFSSDRKGGYNLPLNVPHHGSYNYQTDIYVSLMDENNQWGMPINLGPVINTKYCDRTPFLHPDMKTLYFASDGHGGMGLKDVYKSTRLSDSCWNCWSEPINLGKEVNTEKDDWGYKISTNGEKAYFSKGSGSRTGGEETNDIYYIDMPLAMRPDFVASITGNITDINKRPMSATIVWEDLITGEIIGTSQSDPTNGSYIIVLPLGKMYGYFVAEDGYYPTSSNIDLRDIKTSTDIVNDIMLTNMQDMLLQGLAVAINNLFFDFGKSTLLPQSIPELERVANMIKTGNNKVEISGHTDSIGDAQFNQTLSEQRAEAVKQFLVQAGCDATMLTTKGYGSTKPVETNDTDEGRAKNRRVELRFVK